MVEQQGARIKYGLYMTGYIPELAGPWDSDTTDTIAKHIEHWGVPEDAIIIVNGWPVDAPTTIPNGSLIEFKNPPRKKTKPWPPKFKSSQKADNDDS